MKKPPSIFSFFAGAGFLDLGFEMSGYETVYVNEIHQPFLETYIHSRKVLGLSEPKFGYHLEDMQSLIEENEKARLQELIQECRKQTDLIGFIGGPPCPDFSVGGKNRGREGENGKLSATYVELICSQKPDFFLFENVKGLWRTKKHRAFYEEMKEKFYQEDYIMTERLINTMEYGVPQHRERIILIGFQKDLVTRMGEELGTDKMLPDGIFPWERHIKFPREQLKQLPWPTVDEFEENAVRSCPQEIPPELTVEYWFEKNGVTKHPNAESYFQPRAGLTKFLAIQEGDDSKKSYKRLHRWRYSPTACYGNNEVHLHPYKARRISIAEALALQSLPKEYELPPSITLTNAFKTVGNGVPYLASKAIAETILDFLKSSN